MDININVSELFKIIGQKEYFINKLQADLFKQQQLNKDLEKNREPPKPKK